MSRTPSERGAHQRLSSSGLVMASKTRPGGARKMRRMTSSRSDARSTRVAVLVTFSFSLVAFIGFLLLLELDQELVQGLEARVPHLAVPLEPVVELAQGLRPQLVDSLLRARLDLHQPRLLEH